MKKIALITIGIIFLSIVACKKEPVETYYFNCKIDGQYFEPENQGGLGEYPITAKLLYDGIDLRIDVSKGIKNIFIAVRDSTKVKTQHYQLTNTPYKPTAIYDDNLDGNEYRTDSTSTGYVNLILLDEVSQVIEGSFYFNAYNSVLNDTIQITDGKFKLKYTLH
ncbi:MAG: hypothetical protein IT275_12420 [Chitinophagales bacterium]|nr:hypothetical protein [Chitinophagales bacterium]